MADDATGRSKPTARRRRSSRSTRPEAVQAATPDGMPSTGAGSPNLEPDPSATEGGAAVVDIWPMPDAGPDRAVCPFFRSIDDSGTLVDPIGMPDPANRCAAMPDAVPQSLRQQELVCLTTTHTSCPRYLRGALVETEAPARWTMTTSKLTPATIGALALLAAAFSASIMFTFARGGLDIPVAGAVPTASAVAGVPSAQPTVEVSEAPSVTPAASPSTTPTPSPEPSPSPTSTPSPSPSATPAPTPSPVPTSDRYALLKPCPDKPDCWIYRVRSGDNLFSIANYFGVPLSTVKALNPWTANGLRAGRDLILPPPTR